jgi:2-aminoadipate transaminase
MTYILEEARAEIALATWTKAIKRSALQEMLTAASRPGLISFALGLPAPELFPGEELAQAAASVLASDPKALQYQPHFQPLKAQVVELMKRRNVFCREEQVFLTAGAQQGMNLLVHLLLEPGGKVLMEDLIYTGFQQLIEPFQPEILTVSTSAETGINVDQVEALLKEGTQPNLIYVITDGHNPLGVSLPRAQRERLVNLACSFGVPIIEDDAYGLLHYDGAPTPPLRALDDQWVLYVGSFSKILAPALRVGWVVVPERLIRPLSVIKEATDIDTATFAQRIVSAFLAADHLPSHLAKVRLEYGIRRDAMHSALLEHFPAQARWRRPENGVFFWVETPGLADAGELLRVAIEKERVAFIPGQAFCVRPHGPGPGPQSLRLNFSQCAPAIIEEGISRLGHALNSCCQ